MYRLEGSVMLWLKGFLNFQCHVISFPALVKMYYDASCQISISLPKIHSAKYTVQFSRGTKFMMVLFLRFFFFFLNIARFRDDVRTSRFSQVLRGAMPILAYISLYKHFSISVWYPANNPIRNFPNICVFLSLLSTSHFQSIN